MGSKRFRSIRDFVRHGIALELRCRCGHGAELDARHVYRQFTARSWPVGIEVAGSHFRCCACNRRWPDIGPIERG